jgi:predicted PurR-regulated permease PerM
MTEDASPATTSPPPAAAAPATPAPCAPSPVAPGIASGWTRPNTRWLVLLLATTLIVYLCWLILEPFVDVLMWAIVLVVAFYPVHRRILNRIGSRGWSAAVSCIIVIVTILVPLALVTMIVLRDARHLAQYVQENRESLLHPDPDTALGRLLARADRVVDLDRFSSPEYLAQRTSSLSSAIAARTLNAVGGLLGIIVQVFFVIFTMFYLFRDAESIRDALRSYLPLDRWAAHEIFQRTKDVIHASIYGSLVIALVQGGLGGIMFLILGIPSPILWCVVMILASMVPAVGSGLVWVPAAIYLLLTGHWIKALVLVAWGAGVIGTVDSILRAKVVGQRTRLHELVVFFAVLGGIQVFGLLGIITGPAVAAIAIALFEIWKHSTPPDSPATAPPTTGPPATVLPPVTGAVVPPEPVGLD